MSALSTPAWMGLITLALVVGVLLGGWLTRRRPAAVPDPAPLTADPLARAVLAETRTGYVVLDADRHVLLDNQRARDLGVVRAGFPTDAIAAAAARTLATGETVDVDLTDRSARTGPTAVHAQVRHIGPDLVLVIAADQSAAVKVEAVRRDFVANVSHELKTPIGAILLLAEAVEGAAGDQDVVQHFTGQISKEATRLSTMVTELIALSKLQNATESIEHVQVGVDAVINEVLARSATIAAAAGITVGVGGTPGLHVIGDQTLLVTALNNLVDNAIHYSPAGTAVTVNRMQRGDSVEIAVTDRGVGIPAAQQERVFERFYRADAARSRQTGGTGLGLAIVKHVVANHQGTVSLWSRVGTGSTFTLHLPTSAQLGESGPSSPESATPESAPPGPPRLFTSASPSAVMTSQLSAITAGTAATGARAVTEQPQ